MHHKQLVNYHISYPYQQFFDNSQHYTDDLQLPCIVLLFYLRFARQLLTRKHSIHYLLCR